MNRILLVMIARNEESVIGRCLGAALPQCDAAIVCINGTTDGTREAAQQVAGTLGVPLRIIEHEWIDFGANRTFSAVSATRYAKELGWDLETTWFLLLDADMVLRMGEGVKLRELVELDGYDIVQKNGALEYPNIRLARASKGWRADAEPTHEYWEADGPATRGTIKPADAWIDDRCDGSNRPEKYERDERLLKRALERDPKRVRSRFYLGETYFNSGKFAAAAEHYAIRADAGGYEAERWFARFRLGVCQLKLGQGELGAGTLLRAFNERPSRAEPLHVLGKHYREQEQWQLAAMVLERALLITKPDSDLFVEGDVYSYEVKSELACVWYRTGKREQGRLLCEALAKIAGGNAHRSAHVACLLSWYAEKLPGKSAALALPEDLCTFNGTRYSLANPSIVRLPGVTATGEDLVVRNVRLVNYDQKVSRWYQARDADRVIRTQNVIDTGDGQHVLDVSLLEQWDSSGQIHGLEDLRLFAFDGWAWFTATCCQVPGAGGNPRVVLGRLSTDLKSVDHLVPLTWKGTAKVEKNWLAWVIDGRLRVVYSWCPFIVLDVDATTGECTPAAGGSAPALAKRWRGSARPVFVDGRWIAIEHEVAYLHDRNVYLHRLVEIEPGVGVRSYSEAFYLDHHQGVEFVCGAEEMDGGLVITYGVEDREAREHWLTAAELERLLPRGKRARGVELAA